MAYDFIIGNTDHNWARGYSVLLPKTPDSSSMGRIPPPAPSRQITSALQRGHQAVATSPGASPDDDDAPVASPGRRSSASSSASSKDKDSSPSSDDDSDSSGWMESNMNDDELAVAMDGGSCEMDALARVRGLSWIGRMRSYAKKSKSSSKPAPRPATVRQEVQDVEETVDRARQTVQPPSLPVYPDVDSGPLKLHEYVSSTADLVHVQTMPGRQIGPHSWSIPSFYFNPNPGNKRLNFKVIALPSSRTISVSNVATGHTASRLQAIPAKFIRVK